eukprot:10736306-Ditylum_brightwellii.AAC.1
MEKNDEEITGIMKEAEDKIQCSHKSWWSDTLHHAFQIHKYWKEAQSFKPNNVNSDMILQSRRNDIDPEAEIYQGDKERSILSQLRKAKKRLAECKRKSTNPGRNTSKGKQRKKHQMIQIVRLQLYSNKLKQGSFQPNVCHHTTICKTRAKQRVYLHKSPR